MGKFIKVILTACAAGVVSFAFPRLLIAAGVPLNVWIVKMGTWLGAPPDWINVDTAVWLFTLILGFLLFGIESFLHPLQRFWRLVTGSSQTTPLPVTPNFAVERRQIADTEIATLTADEQSALRQMLITGRPKDLNEQIWQSLEKKTSFVERDFTGPKGIKNEFRPVLEEVLGSNRKPVILAELETTVSPIGDFTPACAIRVTNTGPELEEKCLVQIENHGLKIHMPDPFVIRTEGQIRGKGTGRFTLSTGQPKLIPILFREPARINQFRFIGEDGEHYLFTGDSADLVVAIYGATTPTKVRVHLSVGQDWKVNCEMEYC